MGSRTAPSEEARARLREEAAALEVEDIVDLCCARGLSHPGGKDGHDPVRVAIYLEALRQKPGGSERAQLGALLLCFDLARHGDETRDVEVQLLLPVVDALTEHDARGVVRALTEKSDAVLALWNELVRHARARDRRAPPPLPVFNLERDEGDPDGPGDGSVEIDLFNDADIVELEGLLDDVVVVDAEAADAWERAFDQLWVPGSPLFSADAGSDLERLERLQQSARSFSSSVPMAAQTQALGSLFLATHTRALGLFGRRNKRRDAALREALTAFINLPAPPSSMAAWFIPGGDVPGAEPHAWEKMAEVLIDFAGYLGRTVDSGGDPARAGFVDDVIGGYLKDARSAHVPPVLAPPGKDGQRRRR